MHRVRTVEGSLRIRGKEGDPRVPSGVFERRVDTADVDDAGRGPAREIGRSGETACRASLGELCGQRAQLARVLVGDDRDRFRTDRLEKMLGMVLTLETTRESGVSVDRPVVRRSSGCAHTDAGRSPVGSKRPRRWHVILQPRDADPNDPVALFDPRAHSNPPGGRRAGASALGGLCPGAEGYAIEAVGDGDAALERLQTGEFDLAILDIMMPGTTGLQVCREIRGSSSLPVILLTARDSELDTVVGLEAGADDYVRKPFSVAELVGRVAALLRRRQLDATDRSSPKLSIAGLDIDPLGRTVEADGREVRLTAAEFDLLVLLANAPGQVFTRRAIMEHLWRTPFFGDERAADTHVSNLRRKVERDQRRPTRILTVRGVGYKLAATDP